MSRSSKTKKIDKRMDQLRKEFKKSSIVLRKNRSGLKKSASAARFAASLQAEPMMASVLTYLATIIAMGGKHKAAVKAMLQECGIPDANIQPILGSFEDMIDGLNDPLMEDMDDEIDSLFWLDFEPTLIEMWSLTEEFDSPSQRLSVSVLNEEAKRHLVKGKKASKETSPKELTPREMALQKFFHFYDLFRIQLEKHGITDDDRRAKFLVDMVNLVNRINIKKGEGKP